MTSRMVECCLYIATILTSEYWAMVALMSVFGFAGAGRINVQAVYLQEWVPRKSQTFMAVAYNIESSISDLLIVLLLWFVT